MNRTVDTTELQEPALSPLLVTTKLHPPPRREQTVARTRLFERLRGEPGVKLTVVAAPAGYGKTTLLGTWREWEEESRPIAWLSLDEADNDPVALWSHVLAALRGIYPELEVPSAPERIGAPILNRFLPELVNGLAAVGEGALVLDDFHLLSAGAARDSVAWFVGRVPSTFQLVLATRSEPALPLAALRAHGELLELRADELGFTPAEAEVLLNDRLDLDLKRESIETLVARTEGWPAGLYLSALSLRAVDDRDEFATRFGSENRHVVDFLVDEVLEAHDREAQTLMLRSSILDRLCGPLCDAVLEQDGSARLLDALSRENLFLIPLDDRGEWYRFHHLFAQLLRVELEHREPGITQALHLRASSWHRDRGSVDAAIEHAVEAGAFAEAGELIAAEWIHYVNICRPATVLSWLERFPQELLRRNPLLLLVDAWVLSLCAKREAAAEAIAAIEQMARLRAGPLPDGFSSFEASLATLRAMVRWGDVGAGLENARRAAELEGPESPWRPTVCSALGECLYYRGEFDEADRWLAESADIASMRGQWSIAATSLSYRSLVAGEKGRHERQTMLAEQAVKLAADRGAEDAEGEAAVALGASLAVRGEVAEALALFERGVAVLRSAGHPLNIALALIHQAGLFRTIDRQKAAASAIADATAALGSCPDPGNLAERLAALHRRPRMQRRNGAGALSDRELVILRMLSGRLSERDIGRELYLSHNTVHSHAKSIYRKLGVSSRLAALESARALGLI
jgi:LuxR family maltose regulon positive regulatory protein